MICKNCVKKLGGDYCNNCGQKSNIERITLKYLINEIPNSIFQLNRGFLYTIKELFIRPGFSIKEFLSGKRINHYKPISFLIVTSTIYVLSTYMMDKDAFFYDFIAGFLEGGSGNDEPQIIAFLDWLSKYQVYIPLLILPIFSVSTYIAFLELKYNYVEHLVVNFYITGQQMIIYSIFGFIFLNHYHLSMIPLIIGLIYNFWALNQLFEKKELQENIFLIMCSYFIFVFILCIPAIIVVAASN